MISDLVGQFVVFYVEGADVRFPTIMTVKQFQDIGGRLFVTGRQPKEMMGIKNWLGRIDTHIAWDAVNQFHIFADYKAFIKEQGGRKGGLFSRFKS